ncbi:hypothetical protein SESBI_27050 [Sesbania bispinosa]|nr:hypothetical protein SESBI_27050 [Sesbania bispinosa]
MPQKVPDAPKGCWELDPTTISSEQLEVIEVVKDKDMVMVNNEDAIIKETIDDSMKETDSEEMNNDMGTHGEEKMEILKLWKRKNCRMCRGAWSGECV